MTLDCVDLENGIIYVKKTLQHLHGIGFVFDSNHIICDSRINLLCKRSI